MEKGLTLVIPLYNKIKCIRQTLDSVLNNHGSYPFKCIIVDDDSTDGSSEIALEYDRNYPDMFQYVKRTHHERKTAVYARNMGIMLADTEYIGFLDADDELCAGFIDRGCKFLDDHPEYNLYGNGSMFSDKNGTITEVYLDRITKATTFVECFQNGFGNIYHGANIYKTVLVQNNLFTDVFAEDVVFKFKYVYHNEPVYLDMSTAQTVLAHLEYSGSNDWNHQNSNEDWATEIMKTIINEINDNKFVYYYDDSGLIHYHLIR